MVHTAAPTPSASRSGPAISARVAASIASTAGWRVTGFAMPMRTRIRPVVASVAAAALEHRPVLPALGERHLVEAEFISPLRDAQGLAEWALVRE